MIDDTPNPYGLTGSYVDDGDRIGEAMRHVWQLSSRADPFGGDETVWSAFGLAVAATLEAADLEKRKRAAVLVNRFRQLAESRRQESPSLSA